jgi:hypothetical protein
LTFLKSVSNTNCRALHLRKKKKKKKNIHAYFAILVFQCFSKGNKKFGLLKIHTNKQTSKGTKKQVFNNNNSLLLLTFVLFFCLFSFCFLYVFWLTEAYSFLRKNVLKNKLNYNQCKNCIYIFFFFAKSKHCSLLIQKREEKKKEKQKEKNKQTKKRNKFCNKRWFFDFQKQAVKALRL